MFPPNCLINVQYIKINNYTTNLCVVVIQMMQLNMCIQLQLLHTDSNYLQYNNQWLVSNN